MNRKINLISHESQNIDGMENIPIDQIDSIYSYSCELLVCKYFNVFDDSVSSEAINALLEKIRPNGQLIVGVLDVRQLCLDFVHRKIDNKDFFTYMKNTHNHYGIDEILSSIDSSQSCTIVETKYNNYMNYLTVTRIKP